MVTGYLHPGYAESLAEFGVPRLLPRCGGWLLTRQIPGFPYHDAMGCYPLFACQDWSQLHADLQNLGDELVSLVLVTDPFGEYDLDNLRRCFRDVVVPFKEHYVADLHLPVNEIAGRRHRKHARRALRNLEIEVCPNPSQFVDEWLSLYDNLVERHSISGIQAFSRAAFVGQMSIPGMVILRAVHQGVTVGAQLYFMQSDAVYCHLGAANKTGYDLGAIYALDWFSLEYFSDRARWLDLGGSAGITSTGTDGLNLYKRSWSTETRTVYLCGRILNPQRYSEIVQAKGIRATGYFPAYRQGEFG